MWKWRFVYIDWWALLGSVWYVLRLLAVNYVMVSLFTVSGSGKRCRVRVPSASFPWPFFLCEAVPLIYCHLHPSSNYLDNGVIEFWCETQQNQDSYGNLVFSRTLGKLTEENIKFNGVTFFFCLLTLLLCTWNIDWEWVSSWEWLGVWLCFWCAWLRSLFSQ